MFFGFFSVFKFSRRAAKQGRRVLVSCLFLLLACMAHAQQFHPVKWKFATKKTNDRKALLVFTATIDKGWHVYATDVEPDGPLPTRFSFTPSEEYELMGDIREESGAITAYDSTFMMDIKYFKNIAIFSQRISLNTHTPVIHGIIEFMTCNDERCLPPEEVAFTIHVNDTSDINTSIASQVATRISPPLKEENKASLSFWKIFVSGLLGGLAALLMPCIFPMIPFTVSFFTKESVRSKAVFLALAYGASIVLIYVVLGLAITLLFGAGTLNDLSTNGIFNILFFVLLVAFAASMMGAFEISFPSTWTNSASQLSDSKSGLLGIFFMALTLSLVSFSCTGPIVGTLLVQAAAFGDILGPAIGMLGFSLALAIPFTLFSAFPSVLTKLPRSGSWLNSFKVVLGFLELALALKFLSNVDLAYHWNWFDREVFLVLWIMIFSVLGFYLLGKIKFPHDTKVKFMSPFRVMLAMVTLAFSLYMVPGLWGAPLNVIAAFLPPQQSQDFDLYTSSLVPSSMLQRTIPVNKSATIDKAHKYQDLFQAPYSLNAFFDFEEGMAYANNEKKPVMIDFTGHACVNCRKMEAVVWPDPMVLSKIREDYVLIQLYVDDKTPLAENEQFISSYSGKKITTLGNKWSDFQAATFDTNSQPYYVLLDEHKQMLSQPRGADYDIQSFLNFLSSGLQTFKRTQK